MRRNPLELTEKHANRLRALRNLESQQFLSCHHIGEVVAKGIQIIHAIRDDDPLLILFVFKELLHAGVKIANVGRRLDHHLAVKHQLETQHSVS